MELPRPASFLPFYFPAHYIYNSGQEETSCSGCIPVFSRLFKFEVALPAAATGESADSESTPPTAAGGGESESDFKFARYYKAST